LQFGGSIQIARLTRLFEMQLCFFELFLRAGTSSRFDA
jgi:hypothetical protein